MQKRRQKLVITPPKQFHRRRRVTLKFLSLVCKVSQSVLFGYKFIMKNGTSVEDVQEAKENAAAKTYLAGDALILSFQGGIGKHILATSMIRWAREKFPDKKIMVVSAYPEIFEYNPHIYRNLTLNQPYLFEDYIKNNDFRVGEPYSLHEYYRDADKMHITKLYPKAYGFNEYNENPQTEIFLTEGEKAEARQFLGIGAPVITIQASGGVAPGQDFGKKIDSVQRDMPYAMGNLIVEEILRRGFRLLQVRSATEPELPRTIQLQARFRGFISIASQAVGHIGIDSSMMHATAVFKKPMLIFWSQTHVDNLGYTYPGVVNKWREGAMYGRPAIAMPDNAGTLPYRSQKEIEAWNYSRDEVIRAVEDFVREIGKTFQKKDTKEVK